MDSLREEYLEKAGLDPELAAINFAYDLTVGDSETLKAGYSPANAARAASEVFGVDRELIRETVEIRIQRSQDQ